MPPPAYRSYPLSTKKPRAIGSGFHCQRVSHSNVISVYSADSYLLAEYNERNGLFSWQRLLLLAQKAQVEAWVREKFPVLAKPVAKEAAKAKAASR